MKAYKIDITAWTSSFKYPNLISGYQPTLEVPPISTVLGLINAAAGKYIRHEELEIGYYFEFKAKQVDLETIYQIELHSGGYPKSGAKPNVIQREFLYDNRLIIYLTDSYLAEKFRKPVYPLLLGRSGDLATVNNIEEVELKSIEKANKIKGQIVPFSENFLPGTIQPLPKYFTDSSPRRNLGTEPFSIIRFNAMDANSNLPAYIDFIDNRHEIHIYFHQINFAPYYDK